MAHGRVTARLISAASFSGHLPVAIFVDVLHGSRLRRGDLFQLVHLGQVLVGSRGFLRIHFADREADVHHDVLADLWIGNVLQAGLARDAAVIDAAHPHAALLLELDDLSGNCQTHNPFTSAGPVSAIKFALQSERDAVPCGTESHQAPSGFASLFGSQQTASL